MIDGLNDTAWGRASVHATASCGPNVEHKIKAFLAGGILALGLFGVAMAEQLEDGHESPITAPTSVGKGETAVPMITHGGTFNVPASMVQLTLPSALCLSRVRALKDTYHRIVERISAAPSLFAPEPRQIPVSSERITAAAFRASAISFPPFAYPSALEGW